MSKGLGYLQEELIRYATEHKRITLYYAQQLYGSKTAAKSALLKLQAQGLLTPSGMGEWKPTDKVKLSDIKSKED
jgi:hypothetical protein